MELSSLSEERLIILLQVMNNSDEINYFKNNYQNKAGITWSEAQKSTGSTIAQSCTRSDGRSHRFQKGRATRTSKKEWR